MISGHGRSRGWSWVVVVVVEGARMIVGRRHNLRVAKLNCARETTLGPKTASGTALLQGAAT